MKSELILIAALSGAALLVGNATTAASWGQEAPRPSWYLQR